MQACARTLAPAEPVVVSGRLSVWQAGEQWSAKGEAGRGTGWLVRCVTACPVTLKSSRAPAGRSGGALGWIQHVLRKYQFSALGLHPREASVTT